MSYGLVLSFDDVGEDKYWAVNDRLGIERDGSGNWPEGLIHHGGGPTAGGGWVVMEMWESKAHQEAFMGSRLGEALGVVGVPEPSGIIESDLVNLQSPS